MLVSWRDAAAAAFSSSAAPKSSKHFAVHATGNPPQLQGGRCWARGKGGSSHTSGGTPAAILPTSSSACIIFLMRAAGKRGLSPFGGMIELLPRVHSHGARPAAWGGPVSCLVVETAMPRLNSQSSNFVRCPLFPPSRKGV